MISPGCREPEPCLGPGGKIDQSRSDKQYAGDSNQFTTLSGNNGVLDNASGASNHLEWIVPHIYQYSGQRGKLGIDETGAMAIHVRTDVDIEVSSGLSESPINR